MRPSSTEDALIMPAGPLDGPVIAALQNEVFPKDPWSQTSIGTLLDAPGSMAFVASGRTYGETMPIGFVMARVMGDQAEILTLGVIEEARRHGLGLRLLEQACARAQSLGAQEMYLEVGAQNEAAVALYESYGFAETGRRKNYYEYRGGEREDAVVMAKGL